MFILLHTVNYKSGNFVGSTSGKIGQILPAEARIVFLVISAAFNRGNKLLGVAEYAVGELLKKLDVQSVVLKIVIVSKS